MAQSLNFFGVLILSLISCSVAQVEIPEGCRDLPVVQNFDIPSYLGRWYEIERYAASFELGGICSTANYGLNEDGTVYVYNTLVIESTNLPVGINGTARLNSTDGSAKLAVNFPITGPQEAPYWVLDTDYENYSVVWACRPLAENTSAQTAWFLSRSPYPSAAIRYKVYSVLAGHEISLELLNITEQYGCWDEESHK